MGTRAAAGEKEMGTGSKVVWRLVVSSIERLGGRCDSHERRGTRVSEEKRQRRMNGIEAQLPSKREPNSSELMKEGAKGQRRFQTVQGKGKPCESGESGWCLEASSIRDEMPTASYICPRQEQGHQILYDSSAEARSSRNHLTRIRRTFVFKYEQLFV